MASLFTNRVTIVWALLVVASLLSWESMTLAGDDARIGRAAILVIAFIKVRMIGLEFMELRDAPLPLRIAFEAWGALVCGVLLVLFW